MNRRTTDIVLVVAGVAVAVIAVVISICLMVVRADITETIQNSGVTAESAKPEKSFGLTGENDPRTWKYLADELCLYMAPNAVRHYISDSPDRDMMLMEYFLDDADGLEIPVEQIRHDDAVSEGSGYVSTANRDEVTCIVKTEAGVTWEVYYSGMVEHEGRADSIVSHDEGRAYNLHPNAV